MRRARSSRLMVLGVAAVLIVLAGLVAPPPALPQAKDHVLKYSDLGPPRGPRAESLIWWGQEIERRTNGRVKVEFHWNGSLAKGPDTLRVVGAGLVETGSIIGIYAPVDLPVWNLANNPHVPPDPWVGMRTWHEMRQTVPELAREAADQGVRILMNFTTGPVNILSKNPVLSERDLKGKKIRSAGGWTPLLKSMGALTDNLSYDEVYEALEKGTIEGSINFIPFVKSYKHYELAGHITEARLGQVLGYGAGINLKLWNSMPEEIRAAITEVSEAFIDRYARAYLEQEEKTKQDLIAGIDGKRVQFHKLSDEERNRWLAKSTFVDDWVKRVGAQGIDSRKIVDTLGRIREKYEAELAAKGYPWAPK
jgi:TRAP-type transport system periplasmic protein